MNLRQVLTKKEIYLLFKWPSVARPLRSVLQEEESQPQHQDNLCQ